MYHVSCIMYVHFLACHFIMKSIIPFSCSGYFSLSVFFWYLGRLYWPLSILSLPKSQAATSSDCLPLERPRNAVSGSFARWGHLGVVPFWCEGWGVRGSLVGAMFSNLTGSWSKHLRWLSRLLISVVTSSTGNRSWRRRRGVNLKMWKSDDHYWKSTKIIEHHKEIIEQSCKTVWESGKSFKNIWCNNVMQ